MDVNATVNPLANLNLRRQLCREVIRYLSQYPDDPRQPEAIAHYQAQLAEIDREIEALTGTPPPVVVGLKAAQISVKAK